jgi:hypothetical protein
LHLKLEEIFIGWGQDYTNKDSEENSRNNLARETVVVRTMDSQKTIESFLGKAQKIGRVWCHSLSSLLVYHQNE